MFDITLRVTSTEQVQRELVEWVASLGYTGLSVYEVGSETEKPHLHFLIHSEIDIKKFRNKLVYKFPSLVGNQDYCLKLVSTTVKRYFSYLCKGENGNPPIVVWSYGLPYSSEHVLAAFKDREDYASVSKKRKLTQTSNDIITEIASQWHGVPFDRRAMATDLRRLWRASGKQMNDFQIVNAIKTVEYDLRCNDIAYENEWLDRNLNF